MSSDARRFWDAMHKRLEEFSLSLHPDKTRLSSLVAMPRPDERSADFEGCKLSIPWLCFHLRAVAQRTLQLQAEIPRDRMRAKLREIKEELWRRMHQAIPEQGRWLAKVIRGYFAYHAVPPIFRHSAPFSTMLCATGCGRCGAGSQKDDFTWEWIQS